MSAGPGEPRRLHRTRRSDWLVPLTFAAVTALAFLPALHAGFVTWDDDRNFTDNLAYRGLGATQLHWMWTTFHMGHYVPISWMTLGLDYVLWGMDARGYHLTNVVIHAACAAAVFVVARRILALAAPGYAGDARRLTFAAGASALLWSVHPLRVESVAWITERRDVLSGLFYVLAVWCYLRFIEARQRRWYGVAVVAFVAALLSKASAMTLPAVLLAINVFPLRRITSARAAFTRAAAAVYRELAPFVVLSVGAASLSLVALHPPAQLAIAGKLAVSAWSLQYYFTKTIFPTALTPLLEMPRHVDAFAPRYLIAYVVVVVACAAVAILWRRARGAGVALAVFLVVLLPTLGFVQNGPQIAADRYTYQAAPALALLAGAGILLAPQRWYGAVRGLAAIAIAAFGAATWIQCGVWKDSITLWSRIVAIDPGSPIGNVGIGGELARQGRFAEAVPHYQRAIAVGPAYPEAHNNLGVALTRLGRPADAVAEFAQAIALKPAYAEAFSNRGNAHMQLGDTAAALADFRQATEIDHSYPDAQVNWGNALVRLGRPAEAISHYEAAVAIRADDADARFNWGVALARLQRFPDAAEQFRRVVAISPARVDARDYLRQVEALSARPGGKSP